MRFDGTLLITDPCYIVKSDADWQKCAWGADMGALGFTQCLYIEAGGDIVGKVYNTDTADLLGRFCTDSGVIVVIDYAEALRCNSQLADELTQFPHIGTVIHGFCGDVEWNARTRTLSGTGSIPFTIKIQ